VRHRTTDSAAASLVDVGGFRLSIRTAGSGGPPVVCVSALGCAHDIWADAAALLAETTTVITYGRPGLGGSDRLPAEESAVPRDGRWVAEQLRTLLRAADVAPPYVLSSGSIGAFVIDRFAAAWPDEVAGLVLHDPTRPRPHRGVANPNGSSTSPDGDLPDVDGGGGLIFSGELVRSFLTVAPPENRDGRFVVLSSAVGRWVRDVDPQDWHRPLTLADIDVQWQEMQREWAQRLHAVHLIADTAGHHIYLEEPQLTAAVVGAVVDAARQNRPVDLDDATLGEVGASRA